VRALTVGAIAVVAGAGVGGASLVVAAGEARRAALAVVVLLGVASCAAAAWNAVDVSLAARLRRGGLVGALSFAAAWSAVAVAGRPALVGSALVVAAAAVLACGVATATRAVGVASGRAVFLGAATPLALAASIFVADPFVEWRGSSTPEAPSRAAAVLAVEPIASIARDAGLDWQRSKWLYDGPTAGAPGLSVIGRYYPSSPSSPWTWGGAAAVAGFVALALATPRRTAAILPPC
jgi:hypothetical protein